MAGTQEHRTTADDGNEGIQGSSKGKDLWRKIVSWLCLRNIAAVLCLAFIVLLSKLLLSSDAKTVVSLTNPFLIAIGILILISVSPTIAKAVLPRIISFKLGQFEAQLSEAKQKINKNEDRLEILERINEQQAKLEEQRKKLDQQQVIIQDIVKFSMSRYIFRHLFGIAGLYEYRYNDTEEMRRELGFLKDNGLIQPRKLGVMVEFNASLTGCNLADIVEPTPIAWFYIKVRQEYAEELLEENKANVKEYVWEEIRRKTDYPYHIAEQIAARDIAEHRSQLKSGRKSK